MSIFFNRRCVESLRSGSLDVPSDCPQKWKLCYKKNTHRGSSRSVRLLMSLSVFRIAEFLATFTTSKRNAFSVFTFMPCAIRAIGEFLATNRTRMRLYSDVCYEMSIQFITTAECLATLKTFVGPVSSVGPQMSIQSSFLAECLFTIGTFKWPFSSVRSFMLTKMWRRAEVFLTLVTLMLFLDRVSRSLLTTAGVVIPSKLGVIGSLLLTFSALMFSWSIIFFVHDFGCGLPAPSFFNFRSWFTSNVGLTLIFRFSHQTWYHLLHDQRQSNQIVNPNQEKRVCSFLQGLGWLILFVYHPRPREPLRHSRWIRPWPLVRNDR